MYENLPFDLDKADYLLNYRNELTKEKRYWERDVRKTVGNREYIFVCRELLVIDDWIDRVCPPVSHFFLNK